MNAAGNTCGDGNLFIDRFSFKATPVTGWAGSFDHLTTPITTRLGLATISMSCDLVILLLNLFSDTSIAMYKTPEDSPPGSRMASIAPMALSLFASKITGRYDVFKILLRILDYSIPDYDIKNICSIVEYLYTSNCKGNAKNICEKYGEKTNGFIGFEDLRFICEKYRDT